MTIKKKIFTVANLLFLVFLAIQLLPDTLAENTYPLYSIVPALAIEVLVIIKPIGNRSEVLKADYSIFLDDTLFSPDALSELKENGRILINTKKDFSDSRIIAIDADKIALEVLKRPITNTIMLGALS